MQSTRRIEKKRGKKIKIKIIVKKKEREKKKLLL